MDIYEYVSIIAAAVFRPLFLYVIKITVFVSEMQSDCKNIG
jgi:hypothetical protein